MNLKKKLLLLLGMVMMTIFLAVGCAPETEESVGQLPVIDVTEEVTVTPGETAAPAEDNDESSGISLDTVENAEEDASVSEETSKETSVPAPSLEDVQDHLEDTFNDIDIEVPEEFISEDGTYTSKEEVAAYIHQYGHLPSNFITKKEAKKLGWVSSEGNLWEVAPGKSIGGDYFGNYEGNLPEKKGRDYYECDIDTDGSYRGAKRIVFSDDGLIYYTEDHYETFELLYGEE